MLLAIPMLAHAGTITSVPSTSRAAGFGGWNLDNVDVVLEGAPGGVGGVGSWFDAGTGDYNFTYDSDFSYQSDVFDEIGALMGIALAKDWPVGEPPGIKIINDDLAVTAPKPTNCIIATSYLADHFLDSVDPQQVKCSSPFQSHKRYKLAMLPTTVDGLDSDGIDLVFNVEVEEGSREYQVFQKINNWTGGATCEIHDSGGFRRRPVIPILSGLDGRPSRFEYRCAIEHLG